MYLEEMFGSKFEEVLNATQENVVIELEEIGGKYGEMLHEMEKAVVEYNRNDDYLTKINCWGTCIQITKDGKIQIEGGDIRHRSMFDKKILDENEFYAINKKERFGDIIRYAYKGKGTHGAIFLLDNTRYDDSGNIIGGVQVFTKNGRAKYSTFEIQYEKKMLSQTVGTLHPYGERAPIIKLEQKKIETGNNESSTINGPIYYDVEIKIGPFFRKR